MTVHAATVRVYRSLVSLYPRSFRDQYGADMVSLFVDQCGDESSWRVCGRAVTDLVLTVPLQHLEERMKHNPSTALVVVGLVVAAAGVGLAVAGGTAPVALVIGLVLAVTGAGVAVATWRRATPAHEADFTEHWWKFVLAAPVLVAGVIVASRLGVNAWFVGLGLVVLSAVLVTTGVVLGLARLAGTLRRIA